MSKNEKKQLLEDLLEVKAQINDIIGSLGQEVEEDCPLSMTDTMKQVKRHLEDIHELSNQDVVKRFVKEAIAYCSDALNRSNDSKKSA